MRIRSNFNTLLSLTQNVRHDNMAITENHRVQAKALAQEQVEVVADMKEFSGHSVNVTNALKAILQGKGRIMVPPMVIIEDGARLPTGVQPTKRIKAIKGTVDRPINAQSIADLNRVRKNKVDAMVSEQEQKAAQASRRRLLNIEQRQIAQKQATKEYHKQLTMREAVAEQRRTAAQEQIDIEVAERKEAAKQANPVKPTEKARIVETPGTGATDVEVPTVDVKQDIVTTQAQGAGSEPGEHFDARV